MKQQHENKHIPSETLHVTLQARGHANISAKHRNSFEFTFDPAITPTGTCIVGASTQGDIAGLLGLRGAVSITIRCGNLIERISAVMNPFYIAGDPLIVRMHPDPQHRSLCIAADKGAALFDRAVVKAMQVPGGTIEITFEEIAGGAHGPGVLFVVGTPIGNHQDLAPRAKATLLSASLILSEDTATTRALMGQGGQRLLALHTNNVDRRLQEALGALEGGNRVALVCKAGMPFEFDPGQQIVRAAARQRHLVVPVPGPDFVTAALCASGFSGQDFRYVGFLPRRSADRSERLRQIIDATHTTIFRESSAQLVATIIALAEISASREISVCRNLTGPGESILRGPAKDLAQTLGEQPVIRGDFTVVVAPCITAPPTSLSSDLRSVAASLVASGVATKTIASALAVASGISRRDLFAAVVAIKDSQATVED